MLQHADKLQAEQDWALSGGLPYTPTTSVDLSHIEIVVNKEDEAVASQWAAAAAAALLS